MKPFGKVSRIQRPTSNVQRPMKFSRASIVKGASWTVAAVALSQLLRVVTNIILARLLAPDLFGIMVIINSARVGITLISDVGIGQNIIHNKESDRPEFYNTAWTINLARSVFLWVVCVLLSAPLADFYNIEILITIFPIAALIFVFGGFTSMGFFLLQKHLRLKRLNVFEILLEIISCIAHIGLAWISPTIWALVLGGLIVPAARMVGSYFLVTNIRHRLFFSHVHAHQILHFGKWIFISTLIFFMSSNFDRLYMGKVLPLDLLGTYGIAKAFSELIGMTTQRLANFVVFPLIASTNHNTPRDQIYKMVAPTRFWLLLSASAGLGLFVTIGDLLIAALYDIRYQEAGSILPILTLGTWITILVNLNEAKLLGLGKPMYSARANSAKLLWLLISLPFAFARYGLSGAIAVVALSDLFRYLPIYFGQVREHFAFGRQDLLSISALLAFTALWETLRWSLGFGISLHAF